jgi:hypothetical protein
VIVREEHVCIIIAVRRKGNKKESRIKKKTQKIQKARGFPAEGNHRRTGS